MYRYVPGGAGGWGAGGWGAHRITQKIVKKMCYFVLIKTLNKVLI